MAGMSQIGDELAEKKEEASPQGEGRGLLGLIPEVIRTRMWNRIRNCV